MTDIQYFQISHLVKQSFKKILIYQIYRPEIEILYKIFKKLIALNRRKPQQGKMNVNQSSPVIGKPHAVQEVSYKEKFIRHFESRVPKEEI